MSLRLPLKLLCLCAPLVSCATEEQFCNQVGCGSRLALRVQTDANLWAAGAYTVYVTEGANEHECHFTVPDAATASGDPEIEITCTPASIFPELGRPPNHCSSPAVRTGCSSEPGHFFVTLLMAATPPSVGVRVERDQQVLSEEQRSPNYTTVIPNGPDCGPVCHQGEESFTVAQP